MNQTDLTDVKPIKLKTYIIKKTSNLGFLVVFRLSQVVFTLFALDWDNNSKAKSCDFCSVRSNFF